MTIKKGNLLRVTAGCVLGLWMTQGHGQSSPVTPVELRYTTAAPLNTVWAMQSERYARAGHEASKGALKLELFLNSKLGNELDTVQQVARGRIDMGAFPMSAGALLVPELALLSLPFLFKDTEQQDCVFDQHLRRLVSDMLARKGVQFLDWTHVGEGVLFGKKPYVKPTDLVGLKARAVPTRLAPIFWSEFGAHAVPLTAVELTSAIQTGLVEVSESSLTFYAFAGLGKIAPVLTLSKMADTAGLLVMNKAIYDKLSGDTRKGVDAMVSVAPAAQMRREVREFEATLPELHRSRGGTVVELSDEQREVWRRASPPIWKKSVDALGGEASLFWQTIQEGIKACSK